MGCIAVSLCACQVPKLNNIKDKIKDKITPTEQVTEEENGSDEAVAPTHEPTEVPNVAVYDSEAYDNLTPVPTREVEGIAETVTLPQSEEGISYYQSLMNECRSTTDQYKAEQFENYVNALYGKEITEIPQVANYCTQEEVFYNNCRVGVLKKSDTCDRIIIYVHGGSFLAGVTNSQLWLMDGITWDTNSETYIPMYPLAPNHTYEEAYELLRVLYEDLLTRGKPITILGDSAGGDLALGFTEYLNELGRPLPDKLVLMSPLLDVTCSNEEVNSYQYYDPTVTRYEILRIGMLWAGNTELSDYHVSPINGDLTNMPDTLVVAGSNEILWPDIMKFYNIMRDNKQNIRLVCGQGLFHVFPLYSIPEADEAKNEIRNFILKD